jgi:hypothetical protein
MGKVMVLLLGGREGGATPRDAAGYGGSSGGEQSLAQSRDGLRDGAARRVRGAEPVEHHEVVCDAAAADGGDRDAGRPQARGLDLALVAQHVGLVDDQKRRRNPGEQLVAGPQRSGE